MVFGDLHLRHIRDWRIANLGPLLSELGIAFHLPLWDRPYDLLEADFFGSGAQARISAIADARLEGTVAIGTPFDRDLLDRLPPDIDRFGENGEFHTLVTPPEGGWRGMLAQGA